MMVHMRKGFVFLAVACVFAGGCGGSNKPSDASKTSDTTASVADFCTARAAADASLAQAGLLGVDYAKLGAALKLAADRAPVEIRADMRTVMNPLRTYFRLLGTVDGDLKRIIANPDFQAAARALNTNSYKAAKARVDTWVKEHCPK